MLGEEDDGGVVGLGPRQRGRRAEHAEPDRRVEGQGVAGRHGVKRDAQRVGGCDERVPQVRLAPLSVVDEPADGDGPEHRRRPADVVGVGVRDDEGVEPVDPEPLEVGDDHALALVHVGRPEAGVDQHVAAVWEREERRIALSHVEEHDVEARPVSPHPRRPSTGRPRARRRRRARGAAARRAAATARAPAARRRRPASTNGSRTKASSVAQPSPAAPAWLVHNRACALALAAAPKRSAANGSGPASRTVPSPAPSVAAVSGIAGRFRTRPPSGSRPKWARRTGAVPAVAASETAVDPTTDVPTAPSRTREGTTAVRSGTSVTIAATAANESWNPTSKRAAGRIPQEHERRRSERAERVHAPLQRPPDDEEERHHERADDGDRAAGDEHVEREERERHDGPDALDRGAAQPEPPQERLEEHVERHPHEADVEARDGEEVHQPRLAEGVERVALDPAPVGEDQGEEDGPGVGVGDVAGERAPRVPLRRDRQPVAEARRRRQKGDAGLALNAERRADALPPEVRAVVHLRRVPAARRRLEPALQPHAVAQAEGGVDRRRLPDEQRRLHESADRPPHVPARGRIGLDLEPDVPTPSPSARRPRSPRA